MNKAQILQRDRYKLKDETDKLASTNTFGIPDNITKLPNSTDYTIPNAKKNDLDSFNLSTQIFSSIDNRYFWSLFLCIFFNIILIFKNYYFYKCII